MSFLIYTAAALGFSLMVYSANMVKGFSKVDTGSEVAGYRESQGKKLKPTKSA